MEYVVDIETDGLISTKIHVMSIAYKDESGEVVVYSTSDYDEMKEFISNPDHVIYGHYFKMFDAPALEKVLGVPVKAKVIDTIALAWYIFPTLPAYSLEHFAPRYGQKKVEITDWERLTYEEYRRRCERDVLINYDLLDDMRDHLDELYDGNQEKIDTLVEYLMFKMDCLAKQQELKVKVDVDKLEENLSILEDLLEEKRKKLVEIMPPGKVLRTKPKVMRLKNGGLSVAGKRWLDELKKRNLPLDSTEIRDEANPGSTKQVKDWLDSLGWEPCTFQDGVNGPVPQVRDPRTRELCDSVLRLQRVEPGIGHLDGYTVLVHRIGVLNAFKESLDEDNNVVASASGLTNTLRLRHSKPVVNLPGVTGGVERLIREQGLSKREAIDAEIRDGQIIRECIIAPEGMLLMGSDITSLEDNTKRHYMWDYDPEYVKEQMEEGFDPHLDLAIRAGACTKEEAERHKKTGELKEIRDLYKMANYSCIYGVGTFKLSKSLGITLTKARRLREAYWKRNWSIKRLPRDIERKVVRKQEWILNPVNGFYYSIRNEKDIFSTLNQGTGSYIFDLWVYYMWKESGINVILQYHDEVLAILKPEDKEYHATMAKASMEKVNEALQLNIKLDVDSKFGASYAEVH